jgi:transcription-repair coupling factor (superfamily II helicase)
MEIRGAGNILGAAQSGHIAAVGFGIYCQLLKRSIAKLKGEKQPPLIDTEVRLDFITLTPDSAPTGDTAPAYIPFSYISSERIRIAIYRRIAEASEEKEIKALKQELRDRFGKLPPTVTRLLTIAAIRIKAAERQIQSLDVRSNKIITRINDKYPKAATRFPTLTKTTPDQKLKELLQYISSTPVAA